MLYRRRPRTTAGRGIERGPADFKEFNGPTVPAPKEEQLQLAQAFLMMFGLLPPHMNHQMYGARPAHQNVLRNILEILMTRVHCFNPYPLPIVSKSHPNSPPMFPHFSPSSYHATRCP